MKPGILISKAFVLIAIFFAACSKPDLPSPNPGPNPVPVPGTQRGSFLFAASLDLSGQPYHSSNLHAVVSITKKTGEAIITNQVLTLNMNGQVKTSVLELPEGEYLLTSFRMTYGNVQTHFAIPYAGSAKAAGYQKPLNMAFTVVKNTLTEIAVQPLKVQEGEQPALYGYPSGAFDNGQADSSPFIKIKLKAIMKIGEIIYDSIPASLSITTWNSQGEMNTTYTSLAAGTNEVQLMKAATRYEFHLSKWGVTEKMALNKQDIDPATVYIFGGQKAAKKLRSERVYRLVNGAEVAESKTDYFYNHLDQLLKIDYWLKNADQTPYLDMTDRFEYTGSKLAAVKRTLIANNSTIKETHFTYNATGKLAGMREVESGTETLAAISYFPSSQEIKVHYTYPGKTFDMNYFLTFNKGNVMTSAATKSNHDNVVGNYDHDLNINPYIHMNWPDILLTHSSKNNITTQRFSYSGSYPVAEPYSFQYKYDNDGYPVEVVKHYRTYPSGNYSYSTKTVLVY